MSNSTNPDPEIMDITCNDCSTIDEENTEEIENKQKNEATIEAEYIDTATTYIFFSTIAGLIIWACILFIPSNDFPTTLTWNKFYTTTRLNVALWIATPVIILSLLYHIPMLNKKYKEYRIRTALKQIIKLTRIITAGITFPVLTLIIMIVIIISIKIPKAYNELKKIISAIKNDEVIE